MSNLRDLIPALKNKRYFNYGGQGPLPQKSLEAMISSWETIQSLGPFTDDVWPYVANEVSMTKHKLGSICGVNAHRIALTENVTSGCVLPLWGLPFSQGDELLVSDCEHPGVVSACKELARRKDLLIKVLPVLQLRNGVNNQEENNKVLFDNLERALTPRTKLVVISHLLWNTGAIMPISLIFDRLNLHPNKPFLLVDAAQSFGQISVKEEAPKADIYAFTGHKWSCGPEGLGGVSLSERVLEQSMPTLIGWRCLKAEGSIYEDTLEPFHRDARRFEIATSCIPLLAGLRCSLDLLEKEGSVGERLKKIKELSNLLWSELKKNKNIEPILEGCPPAGLVSFSTASNYSNKEIVKILGKQNLWIRVLEDPIWLRACLHVTSTENEVNDLVQNLADLVS